MHFFILFGSWANSINSGFMMEHFRKFEIFQESIFWKLTLSELENKLFSQFSLNQKAILVDFAIFNWDDLLRVIICPEIESCWRIRVISTKFRDLLTTSIVETRLNGCTDNRVLLLTPLFTIVAYFLLHKAHRVFLLFYSKTTLAHSDRWLDINDQFSSIEFS